MRGRTITGLTLGALGALVVASVFLAPSRLGGDTIYATIDGISMQPRLHRGELVLVRPQSTYAVGEIALYESPTLHRSVLHRIVAIRDGRYFFKGDNNDFVDPTSVTRSDILGRLWITVPDAGSAVDWLRSPWHSSLVAAIAVFVVFALGLGARVASRRGRRRRDPAAAPAVRHSSERPRQLYARPLSAVGLAAVVLGAVLVVVAAKTPSERTVTRASYTQAGTFSYTARGAHPSSAYPKGVAKTGQPVFLEEFRAVAISFRYRFAATSAKDVHGTIALRAMLWSQSTWHSLATLARPRAFSGTSTIVHGTFPLASLRVLIAQLDEDAGVAGGTYDIELRPLVHVTGTIGGRQFHDTFAPTLPISATQSVLNIDLAAAAPATSLGAHWATPTEADILAAALHPHKSGAIRASTPNHVDLAGIRVPVGVVRILGGALVLAGVALLLADTLRQRREVWPEDVWLAHRHDVTLIDIDALAPGVEQAATTMPDLHSLAALARLRQEPIFRLSLENGGLYVLEDVGRTYVCRFDPSSQPVADTVIRRRLPRPSVGTPRRAWLLRLLTLAIVAMVVGGAAVAFTAGNTVPTSYVGTSSQARQISQLAPSQCASMNLTNLVIGTSSTVTGTNANDLILGPSRSGTVTYSGGGGNDCIVAGGTSSTTNSINGGSGTDVCIGGAHAKSNSYTSCETKY